MTTDKQAVQKARDDLNNLRSALSKAWSRTTKEEKDAAWQCVQNLAHTLNLNSWETLNGMIDAELGRVEMPNQPMDLKALKRDAIKNIPDTKFGGSTEYFRTHHVHETINYLAAQGHLTPAPSVPSAVSALEARILAVFPNELTRPQIMNDALATLKGDAK